MHKIKLNMSKIYLTTMSESDINHETGICKIGVTSQTDCKRLKQLATGNPSELKVLYEFPSKYPFKVETALHNYFREKQITREWFKLNNSDIQLFPELCEKYESNFKILTEYKNPFI